MRNFISKYRKDKHISRWVGKLAKYMYEQTTHWRRDRIGDKYMKKILPHLQSNFNNFNVFIA